MLVHGSFLQPSPTLPSLLFIAHAAARFLHNSKNFPRDKAFDKLRNTPIIIVAGIKSYTSLRTTVRTLFLSPCFSFFCFFCFSLRFPSSMAISSGWKCRERFPESIRFALDFLTDSMQVAFRTRNRETRVHRSCSALAFHLALRSRFSFGSRFEISIPLPPETLSDGTRESSSVFLLRRIERPTLRETRRKAFETPAGIRSVRNSTPSESTEFHAANVLDRRRF